MNRVTHIVLQTIGLTLVVGLFLAAIVWGYHKAPDLDACRSITYILADGDERVYVYRNELESLLRTEDIHPVGRPVDELSLQRIENAVRRHPMVRTAECYVTPWHDARVVITQRVPLLRVQTAAETYLIDTDRRRMEARPVVKDSVLRVTGAVGPQMASTRLADFALWLQDNRYWRERIDHLHMRSPQMVVVCLRDRRQPQVLLGAINDYERKLRKLRFFLENSSEATKDKHYSELDLRFAGQVIAR